MHHTSANERQQKRRSQHLERGAPWNDRARVTEDESMRGTRVFDVIEHDALPRYEHAASGAALMQDRRSGLLLDDGNINIKLVLGIFVRLRRGVVVMMKCGVVWF